VPFEEPDAQDAAPDRDLNGEHERPVEEGCGRYSGRRAALSQQHPDQSQVAHADPAGRERQQRERALDGEPGQYAGPGHPRSRQLKAESEQQELERDVPGDADRHAEPPECYQATALTADVEECAGDADVAFATHQPQERPRGRVEGAADGRGAAWARHDCRGHGREKDEAGPGAQGGGTHR
jgi:hypothetical protein